MPDTKMRITEMIISVIRSTQRWVSDTEAVIIPRKISIIPLQVSTTSRSKTPKASPVGGIMRRY